MAMKNFRDTLNLLFQHMGKISSLQIVPPNIYRENDAIEFTVNSKTGPKKIFMHFDIGKGLSSQLSRVIERSQEGGKELLLRTTRYPQAITNGTQEIVPVFTTKYRDGMTLARGTETFKEIEASSSPKVVTVRTLTYHPNAMTPDVKNEVLVGGKLDRNRTPVFRVLGVTSL